MRSLPSRASAATPWGDWPPSGRTTARSRTCSTSPGRIKLAGTVIDRLERTSAKGNRFAFVQCSDQSGAFELTVFSEVLSAKRNLLEPGQAVLISVDGRLDGEQVKLMAQSVEKLEDAVANSAAGLRIVISDSGVLEALRKSREGKRGRGRVTLVVQMEKDESE